MAAIVVGGALMAQRGVPQKPLTKKGFERLLAKAADTPPFEIPRSRPSRKKPAPVESETSESRRPDGCTETCKSPDTPEGGED